MRGRHDVDVDLSIVVGIRLMLMKIFQGQYGSASVCSRWSCC
jgi:hypothetical protein